MVTKLSKQQEKELIEALEKKIKASVRESASFSDFGKGVDKPLINLEDIHSFLANSKNLPALPEPVKEDSSPDLFSEKGLSTKPTVLGLWEQIKKMTGDDIFPKFIGQYVTHDISTKKDKRAFKSIESPPFVEENIEVYSWELSKFPSFKEIKNLVSKKPDPDASDILSTMAVKDRNSLLGKLSVKAKVTGSDNYRHITIEKPLKTHYLNYTFKTEKFIQGATLLIDRSSKNLTEENREEIVDKLAEILNKIGEDEADFYGSEDYALNGDYGSYAAEDLRGKSLSDIKDNVDEEIANYIGKLEDLEVDDDDIKDMLNDASEETYHEGMRSVSNSVGSFNFSSEEELEMSDDRWDDQVAESGLPYKTLKDNIALLNKEEVADLKRKVNEMSIDFKFNEADQCYEATRAYLYLSDYRSIELVVDEQEFISRAKRKIKDKRLEERGTKLKTASSLQYPELENIISETKEPVMANDLTNTSKNLPPLAKREMIATLYEAIARSALPMDEDRLQWMVNYIHKNMTDNEVNKEWDFILKGNVTKLVKLFQAMKDPNVQEKHKEKIMDLMQLHQEISEGLEKTKEAGMEVDDQTFDFLEKTIMDFADDFMQELSGQKTLPGQDKKKLLSEVTESSKKDEDNIRTWFSSGGSFGKDGDVCWAKDDTLYSYRTIIARKEAGKLYINEKKYSNTTSKLTKYLALIAESTGMEVEQKPEEFFNTTMKAKLPMGYKENVRNLLKQISSDSELADKAKEVSQKALPEDKAIFDWMKIAKLGAKKFATSEEQTNQDLIKMLAAHLQAKFGQKQLASVEYPTLSSLLDYPAIDSILKD